MSNISFFEKPNLIKSRLKLDIRILFPVIFLIAAIILISSILDIVSTKKELTHILIEQSKALITAIEEASQNTLESYGLVEDLIARRLLDNARLIEKIDYYGKLSSDSLSKIAQENSIFRINLFDSNGEKVLSSFWERGFGSQRQAPTELMQKMQDPDIDELVLGFRGSRFGLGQRFAVAKKRRKGGVLILNVDSEDMLNFRKSIGLGRLIQDIGENKGIRYIVLQDSSGIQSATQGIDSMTTIYSDQMLQRAVLFDTTLTRFTKYKNDKIFEIIHPFAKNRNEILRIGLDIGHYKEAETSVQSRVLLSSILLLIFGIVFSSWIISNQNYQLLEKAYFQIETYTKSMLDNMTDAIVAVNQFGKITLVNRAAEDFFKINSKKVLGKDCAAEISPICPYLQKGLENFENYIYSDQVLEIKKIIVVALIHVYVVKQINGELEAVFAVVQDITQQKRLEANLKRQDQITAMGHLASGVAHEIRNPLNAISLIAQRIQSEFEPIKEKEEFLLLSTTMVKETRRINDIIQQFLQFARPNALVKKSVNMEKLVDEVFVLIAPQAQAKGIQISKTISCTVDTDIDSDKIKQALVNLLNNAIDACEKDDTVEMTCSEAENNLIIKISDSGKGIPDDNLNKIFNLYYTTKENGTGIGLSIVQQIVSQHNGTIEIKSKENKGTIFTITLPIGE